MKIKKIFALACLATFSFIGASCSKKESYVFPADRHLTIEDIKDVRKLAAGIKTTTAERNLALKGQDKDGKPLTTKDVDGEQINLREYVIYVYKTDCSWCKDMREDAYELFNSYGFENVYFLNTDILTEKAEYMLERGTYTEDDSDSTVYSANKSELFKQLDPTGSNNVQIGDALNEENFGTPTSFVYSRIISDADITVEQNTNQTLAYFELTGIGVGGSQDHKDPGSQNSALFLIQSFSCYATEYTSKDGSKARATAKACEDYSIKIK